jgi:hypothetical protein
MPGFEALGCACGFFDFSGSENYGGPLAGARAALFFHQP